MRNEKAYVPTSPEFVKQKTAFAMAKLEDSNDPVLQGIYRQFMGIRHMGQLGAAELLLTLGTFLNENARDK